MNYFQSILRSLGQVMFQNNVYTGLIFLIGIFYNSLILGFAALLGTIVSISTAQILNYSKDEIQDGLYGFNGALTGIALWYFFGFSIPTFVALIISAALTTVLNYYLKKIIPPFTFPFIIITWLMMIFFLFVLDFSLVSSSFPKENTLQLLLFSTNSFGQIMFQENKITGVLFLFGILINSRISAIYGVYAAILGSLIGLIFKEPISIINAGFMGYNAILCAIALADKKRESFIWISISTFLSVILTIGFSDIGAIALTAPFVLSTWIVLKFRTYFK